MADKKISQLPASTTPLAGTETLPVVQSGATKQVSVDNLTAGKTVAVKELVVSPGASNRAIKLDNDDTYIEFQNSLSYIRGGGNLSAYAAGVFLFGTNNLESFRIDTNQNIAMASGKGIDFSADGQAAGMTSELLDDYEEGTWTPTQGGGLTVVGTFSSAGTYTKIGRTVNFSGFLSGSTSISLAPGGLMTAGLPFSTVLLPGVGSATNANATASSTFQISVMTLYAADAIGATASIYFSGTYET